MTIRPEKTPRQRLNQVRRILAALWRQEPRWGRMEKILDFEAEYQRLVKIIKAQSREAA